MTAEEYIILTREIYFQGVRSDASPEYMVGTGGGLALAGHDRSEVYYRKNAILGVGDWERPLEERWKVAGSLWSGHEREIRRRIASGSDAETAVYEFTLAETGAKGHFGPASLEAAVSPVMINDGRQRPVWYDRLATDRERFLSELELAGDTLPAVAGAMEYGASKWAGFSEDEAMARAIETARGVQPLAGAAGALMAPYQSAEFDSFAVPFEGRPQIKEAPRFRDAQAKNILQTRPPPGQRLTQPQSRMLGTRASKLGAPLPPAQKQESRLVTSEPPIGWSKPRDSPRSPAVNSSTRVAPRGNISKRSMPSGQKPFDDPFTGQRSYIMGAADKNSALRTTTDASWAEHAAFDSLVHKENGELGLEQPGHVHQDGPDFVTAAPQSGLMWLFANDATLNRRKKLKSETPIDWMVDAKAAAYRFDIGNPAIEAQVRAAADADRVTVRTLMVTKSAGGAVSVTERVPPDGTEISRARIGAKTPETVRQP